MPKTPSTKLYDLIHALSGSEKRYFKLFVQKKGEEKNNKYLRLFDAIEAQTEFNDEALQQIVYDQQPVQSRKYSELKAYLYDLILKALQGYDEKASTDFRINSLVQNIRVLYKRGHYNDCKDILNKVKRIATKYERFDTLLLLLYWEKQLAYTLIDVAFFDMELERIEREEKQYFEQLQHLATYRNIFFRLYTILKKMAFTKPAEIRQKLEPLMQSPLLQSPETPSSHHAQIVYYRILSLHAYASGTYEKFYAYNKTLLALMESKPYLLAEDVSEYISVLSNHIVGCRRTHRYDEWEETLDKFLKINANTHDDHLKIHRQYYQGVFSWCIFTGDFERGKVVLEEHLKTIAQYDTHLFEGSAFYFQYFQIYFGNGEYDQALDYLNRWLNQPKSLERQDLQNLARILNLIIHYEMDNTLLLESLLRSTYRYLKKAAQLRPIERKILSFIKDSTKVVRKKEMQESYLKLYHELTKLSATEKTGPFDLSAWLESKIQGKTYREVIREKYLQLYQKQHTG